MFVVPLVLCDLLLSQFSVIHFFNTFSTLNFERLCMSYDVVAPTFIKRPISLSD